MIIIERENRGREAETDEEEEKELEKKMQELQCKSIICTDQFLFFSPKWLILSAISLIDRYLVCVWIVLKSTILCLHFLSFFFFFFFFWRKMCFSKANALSVGLVHCSRDSQTSFFIKIFIKNDFTALFSIHTFKNNYFIIIFLTK